MTHRNALSALLVATVLLGAGCNPAAPKVTPSDSSSERPAAVQGFGQLPPVQQFGGRPGMEISSNFSAGRMVSSISAIAPMPAATEPAVSQDMVVTNVGGGTSAVAIRAPGLPEEAKVTYNVTASMPTWSADGLVYRVRPPALNASLVRSIADAAGVPSQVSNGASEVQGANVSWRDAAGFIWNVDMPGRNLNWWKNVDYSRPQDNTNPNPTIDAAAVKAAADNFLRDHGFGQFAGQGVIEENPMILPLLRGERVACPLVAEGRATPPVPDAPVTDLKVAEDAKLMIYPSPCGYPIQVTVYYPDIRDGMNTVDAGGWMSRKASVQIDIKDNSVVGGNVMLPTSEDSSSYPLISAEDAMARLMAGGNNRIYGWYDGTGTTEVRATISSVKLGWMRYDSWENNTSKTYFLPALLAEGTVDRGSNQPEPEKYYTVVPLVADAAFQTNPNPIMYMKVDPAAMDSVNVPAPAPAVAPKQ